jgi:PIN domain nuclease of toxin-antitoxin system
MKYLLDTVVWLWSIGPAERINPRGLEILQSGGEEIYFSVASAWEVTIKVGLGKLKLPSAPQVCVPSFTMKQGLRHLPVSLLHAVNVYSLPSHHRDPFDRLLISQAVTEGMTVLTAEEDFKKYPVEIVWCGK